MSRYDNPGLVDAFGMDEYGNPHGLGEGWGFGIGMVSGFVGETAVKHFAPMWKKDAAGTQQPALGVSGWQVHAEGLGAILPVAVGGVMAIFEGTRRAGWFSMIGALPNLLRYADDMITTYMASSTPAAAGIGAFQIQQEQLGAALVNEYQALGAAGRPGILGSLAPAPSFSGANLGSLSPQYSGLGQAPQVIPYGSHFGTTAMGAR